MVPFPGGVARTSASMTVVPGAVTDAVVIAPILESLGPTHDSCLFSLLAAVSLAISVICWSSSKEQH